MSPSPRATPSFTDTSPTTSATRSRTSSLIPATRTTITTPRASAIPTAITPPWPSPTAPTSWNCNPNDAANTALAGYVLNNSQNTNIAVGQAIRAGLRRPACQCPNLRPGPRQLRQPRRRGQPLRQHLQRRQRLSVLEFPDRQQRQLLARRGHRRRQLGRELQLRRPERPGPPGPCGPLRAVFRFLPAHQRRPQHHRLSLRLLGPDPPAAVRDPSNSVSTSPAPSASATPCRSRPTLPRPTGRPFTPSSSRTARCR